MSEPEVDTGYEAGDFEVGMRVWNVKTERQQFVEEVGEHPYVTTEDSMHGLQTFPAHHLVPLPQPFDLNAAFKAYAEADQLGYDGKRALGYFGEILRSMQEALYHIDHENAALEEAGTTHVMTARKALLDTLQHLDKASNE